MKIAFIVFDGITFLDFIGFYDVVNRLRLFDKTKETTWDICALAPEVKDEQGLTIRAGKIKPDLSDYDLLFVPGGLGTRKLRFRTEFVDWLRQGLEAKHVVSVCTGSLLLGAAGFLQNRKATTHPKAYELLEPYCKEVVRARIVKDGHVVTGGGVSASIDVGLYVVEMLAGREAADQVKEQIDYPYERSGMVEV
ncbi:DJ-1/PfpI family protein [Paenibacillus chitinolyticus]|uniref:DJ-1/PfpI family protein n=1 Tax=Paenibacillus chitinolyticus TaxID=79263 RepID=UPI002DB83DC0|nr:DJ-1/PfpI family protein [Paenibacillus chitinolyticus]MEC0245279.1 DJ-1/PfpI family protein [Paenibacillus chitinolyticus]